MTQALFYACATATAEAVPLIDVIMAEDDPRFAHYLEAMGIDYLAEAYAGAAARDAAVGPVTWAVEFKALDQREAHELSHKSTAVGPTLFEEGFDIIAPRVVGAALDWGGKLAADSSCHLRVVIARTEYVLDYTPFGRAPAGSVVAAVRGREQWQ